MVAKRPQHPSPDANDALPPDGGRADDAIAWEKALKGKSREKKIALIEERNPRWNDLAWDWYDDQSKETT